jgi:hypothetical protein
MRVLRVAAEGAREVSQEGTHMFALAYVILPFSDTSPADAIRASLAPFQRGQRGDLPESWLSFHDETEALRQDYEAQLTITTQGNGGGVEVPWR